MGQQSIRQAARRAALEAQAQRRRERAERDKRVEALVLEVLAALEERKVTVADCELRAARALRRMSVDEGLTLGQIGEWCGDDVSRGDLVRLRKLDEAQPSGSKDVPAGH